MLAPIVLIAVLVGSGSHQQATAARTSAHSKQKTAPVRVVPVERPDAPPSPKPKPKPVPKPTPPKPTVIAKHSVFSGLGAWIDVYDDLPVGPTIALLRASGVQTLYIETGGSWMTHAVAPRTGSWLIAAHAAGIKVVGWYLPYFAHVDFDVSRIVTTARYTYAGQRLDGVGVDIEWKGSVRSNGIWNRNVVREMQLSRGALGPNYPLASIPPPPLQMRIAPKYWHGFPWAQVARQSTDIMLMSYWSDRVGCPKVRIYCAYEYTRYNVEITRQITGGRVPIHIIGGIGNQISGRELAAFVRGARDAKADGASIYDIATMPRHFWSALNSIRTFGA